MAWASLANDDVPNWTEIREGVAAGEMQWTGCTDSGSTAYANDDVFHRSNFVSEIDADDMSASGIALDDVMTKGEMLLWANTTPGTPTVDSITSLSNYRISCQIDAYVCQYYPSFELWLANETAQISTYNGGTIGEVATIFQLDASYQDVAVKFRARFRMGASSYGAYSAWSNTTFVSGGMG